MRLDIVEGTTLSGTVSLEPALALDRELGAQIATVRRVACVLKGEPCRPSTDKRLARLVTALRAIDALVEGASLRDIAVGILGMGDWPGDGDHVKSWVRRIVRLAEALCRAGPADIIGHAI